MINLLFDINLSSFMFGVLLTIFISIFIRRKKRDAKDYDEAICEDSRFYLNIFFNNRKEIVENIVRSKVSRRKTLLRAVAKRFAVKLVTDEILISTVADDLIVTIPKKLELQSIIATATLVHQHSSFLCIEVNLIGVDFLSSMERNAGKENADKTRRFLESFGFPNIINFINTNLVRIAAGKVIKALPSTLISKLQDKLTADIDVICLNDAEQGPFICQTLQQLKLDDEKEKEKEKE